MDFSNAQNLRSKAEEKLHSRIKDKQISEQETDIKKLVHELQVHQIELEIQNDELRQAYETAESALRKYTLLFDLSPMGYFTLDSEGSICELNFRGAKILAERRFSLIDSNFKLFVSEESRPVFNDFFRRVYTSKAKESCEIQLGYNNRPLGFVYIEGVVTEDDGKCFLSIVDVSKFNLQNNS